MRSVAGILTHNVVNLHSQPDSRSELVSQGICGDTIAILEQSGNFAHIRTSYDYQGWALRWHMRPLEPDDLFLFYSAAEDSSLQLSITTPIADVYTGPSLRFPLMTKLPLGSRVLTDKNQLQAKSMRCILLPDGGSGWVASRSVRNVNIIPKYSIKSLARYANRFIGIPYLWGGTTPFGFDCSGFVQRMYRQFGITIPRDAHLQADCPLGSPLIPEQSFHAGDLVFFCSDSSRHARNITHVGLMLDEIRLIHASGDEGVSITTLESPEIACNYTLQGGWRVRN